MAFTEVLLPATYSQNAVAVPSFSTIVVSGQAGDEQRISEWLHPRRKYEIQFGTRPPSEMAAFLAFFHARGGRRDGFRFRDLTDCTAAGEATVPLTSTTFQLAKTYTSGGVSYVRPIHKPVAATVAVTVSGAPATSGYTLDDTTGVLTFTSAPAATPAWSGTFDLACRFDTDTMRMVMHSPGSISYESVTVIELRPPF